MSTRYDDIFATLYTSEDVKNVLADFETLSASLFLSKKEKVAGKLENILSFELSDSIKQYAKDNKINLEDKEKCKQLLDEISKELRQLPIITLYLAFSPTEGYLKKIASLLYGYCNQKVLLEIVIEKVVLGGAIIAWKGVYKDYSLRKTIDEKYKEENFLSS